MNRSGYAIVALLPCRSCMGFVLEIAIMHLSKIKRISHILLCMDISWANQNQSADR